MCDFSLCTPQSILTLWTSILAWVLGRKAAEADDLTQTQQNCRGAEGAAREAAGRGAENWSRRTDNWSDTCAVLSTRLTVRKEFDSTKHESNAESEIAVCECRRAQRSRGEEQQGLSPT